MELTIHNEQEFINTARCVTTLRNAGFQKLAEEYIDAMNEYDKVFNADRIGTWIPLGSGNRYCVSDPRPGDFDITDIVEPLSGINRFNNHLAIEHYSVAQHSCYVHDIVDDKYKLFALMHDASEAMLGDVITPIKRIIADTYRNLESKLMNAIALQFGFEITHESEVAVKVADDIMLATEIRDVSKCGFINGTPNQSPLKQRITESWDSRRAQSEFMNRFLGLVNGGKTI